ncbi:Alkaline proteinase, partial [Colletotrichum shisoi]
QSYEAVPGKYIVTLKEDAVNVESHLNWVTDVHRRSLGKRDTVDFDEATIEKIKASPELCCPIPASKSTAQQQWSDKSDKLPSLSLSIYYMYLFDDSGAPRGMGATSHRSPGSTSYIYDTSAGADIFACVVDSGVLATHTQFGNRVTIGFNAFTGAHVDGASHGTHVAGTIGGRI